MYNWVRPGKDFINPGYTIPQGPWQVHDDVCTFLLLQCSGDCCGEQAQQRREIQCVAFHNSQRITFPEDACVGASRPPATTPCQLDCPRWVPRAWSDCPACGTNVLKSRDVECVQGDGMVANECCLATKPEEAELCLDIPCPCLTMDSWDSCTQSDCSSTFWKQFCSRTCCEMES